MFISIDLKDVLHNHEKNKTAYLELVCNIRDSASNIKVNNLLFKNRIIRFLIVRYHTNQFLETKFIARLSLVLYRAYFAECLEYSCINEDINYGFSMLLIGNRE